MSDEAKLKTEEAPDGEVKLTEDEKLAIFDKLLFEGAYTEIVTIGKQTSVEFKTRTADEIVLIGQNLEALKPTSDYLGVVYMTLLQLSYGILKFNGRDLGELPPYPARFNFFKKFPSAVIDALQDGLAKFDRKVNSAMEFSKEGF